VLADWNQEAAQSAARELEVHKTLTVRCDVSDEAQVEAMAKQTVATFGRLDAAYNNADVQNVLAETADTTREDYDRVMAVNLRAVWSCMKFELQQMRRQGSSAIVNTPQGRSIGVHQERGSRICNARGIRINAVCLAARGKSRDFRAALSRIICKRILQSARTVREC